MNTTHVFQHNEIYIKGKDLDCWDVYYFGQKLNKKRFWTYEEARQWAIDNYPEKFYKKQETTTGTFNERDYFLGRI
jgi:hypothetical protein